MTDYYIRITDELPVDYDEALWFKLTTDEVDGEDNFFVVTENDYNDLVARFDDATDNFTNESGLVEEAVQNAINRNDWRPESSVNSDNSFKLMSETDSSKYFSYEGLTSSLASLTSALANRLSVESLQTTLNDTNNPVTSKAIKSVVDLKVNSSDFNAYKNAINVSLNNKANTSHSHGWSKVQSVNTNHTTGTFNVWANPQIRLAMCKYYREGATFDKANNLYLQYEMVKAGYRPTTTVIAQCLNPNMGAYINTKGQIEIENTVKGKFNINFTAMWFY